MLKYKQMLSTHTEQAHKIATKKNKSETKLKIRRFKARF